MSFKKSGQLMKKGKDKYNHYTSRYSLNGAPNDSRYWMANVNIPKIFGLNDNEHMNCKYE